jgi:predicted ABC-type ATPase
MTTPESASTAPLIVILGGANGAGKSTAAALFLPKDLTFVNADEVAKTLPGYPSRAADLEADRLVLEQLDVLGASGCDFAVETTLAGRSLAARVERLRPLGYFCRLIFLWSPSAEFSIHRVAARVRSGGHHIPEETIRRRHRGGVRNFFTLYGPLADVWEVYDNIETSGLRLIAKGQRGGQELVTEPDVWSAMKEVADGRA